MSKLGRLPVIARLGLLCGVISEADIAASASIVIAPDDLDLPPLDTQMQARCKRSKA